MTVITTVNPSALLAVTTTTTPTTTTSTTTTSTTTTPTTTTPTTTTSTTTTSTTITTTPTIDRYSLFEYFNIVENAFENFFENTIWGYYPLKFSKKKIAEMRKSAETLEMKKRYEEITVEEIDEIAINYATKKKIEIYQLEEMGWKFVLELAKRLNISPILLAESKALLKWEAENYYY